MNLDREELAWVAGFLDGEGYFGLVKTNSGRPNNPRKYVHTTVTAAQCDPGVLEKLEHIFGFGKVRGPYKKVKKNHRPSWMFQVSTFEHYQAIVASIWEWLGPSETSTGSTSFIGLPHI